MSKGERKEEEWYAPEAFRVIRTTRELLNVSSGLPVDHRVSRDDELGEWFPPPFGERADEFFSEESQKRLWPWLDACEGLERGLAEEDLRLVRLSCMRLLKIQLAQWEPDREPPKE